MRAAIRLVALTGAVYSHSKTTTLRLSFHTLQKSYSTSSLSPSSSRKTKLYPTADAAVADIPSGSTILSSGFGLCGVAETLIHALARRGSSLGSLTVVSNNAGSEAKSAGISRLVASGQVSRLVLSFIGSNKLLEKKYLGGEIAVELCPQGTIAERIRAAGAGIPAFYTPTGVNTRVQTGEIPVRFASDGSGMVVEKGRTRETREFDGRAYLLEPAIKGDVAILRAWKVDEEGNCVFRYTTKGYGGIMARAAACAIVEAEEIVKVGEIHPDEVDLPGVYIDRIVPATEQSTAEVVKLAPASETATGKSATSDPNSPQARRDRIARRTAKELREGYHVNLGVGLPTLAPSFLPPGHKVWLQSENGIMGMGAYPKTEVDADPDIVNAGKEAVTLVPGASTFDSAESFGMIRGGHVDVSVLGALQVSATGDLANYMIPGKVVKGMGGAMDLVSNPEGTKIVVATEHVAKDGSPKIVGVCSLPLTGAGVVRTIITDMCVFEVDRSRGVLILTELASNVSIGEVQQKTDAPFEVAKQLKTME